MWRFILARLGYLVGIMFAVSVLVFVLGAMLPDDAAQMKLDFFANDENLAILREQMGLDRPLWLRYVTWLGGALHGDMGLSLSFNSEITPLVLHRFSQSALLACLALIVSVPLSLGMGLLSGLMRNRLPDHAFTVIGLFGISVPEFVLGVLLIYLFSDTLGWFPAASITSGSPLADPKVLFLPVLTLTMLLLAQVGRLTRAGVIRTLRQDFVRTARLKGMPGRQVAMRHVFPNSISPAISAIGLNFCWMLGSLAVVETMFSFPGLGDLIVFAVRNRDIPLLQACVLVIALAVGVVNLIADLLIIRLDPRLAKEF